MVAMCGDHAFPAVRWEIGEDPPTSRDRARHLPPRRTTTTRRRPSSTPRCSSRRGRRRARGGRSSAPLSWTASARRWSICSRWARSRRASPPPRALCRAHASPSRTSRSGGPRRARLKPRANNGQECGVDGARLSTQPQSNRATAPAGRSSARSCRSSPSVAGSTTGPRRRWRLTSFVFNAKAMVAFERA